MSIAKLEGELLKVKEDMGKAKQMNKGFEHVLQEMSILRSRSNANPQTKEQIMQELKSKEILDLFSSIETDFEELRTQMTKQSIQKEQILDFIESIRIKKTFSFEQTEQVLAFMEGAVEVLDASHISVRPEFIGMIDLAPLAVEHRLLRNASGVIVEKERFSEFLVALIAKKMFHDIIFETDNAKITLKTPHEMTIEAKNADIRALARIAKPTY